MRRAVRLTLLGAASFSLAALLLARQRAPRAFAGDPAAAAPAPKAQLFFAHGEVDGFSTELAVADVDATRNVATVTPLGAIDHPRGSAIRGARFGSTLFVTAKTEAPRNATWSAALFRVESGKVTRLCDGIESATAPWITKTGRVVVARGVDGPEPTAAESQKLVLRTDELTLDDVDPVTGAVHTLWRGQGYQAFVAAQLPDERLVVYHSHRGGAALFTLDPATGQAKPLASVAPWARDFSVDRVHGRLVFADLGPDARTFQVLALDLASHGVTALYGAPNEHLMPFALPSGDVVFSSDGDKGLAVLPAGGQPRLLTPLGDGSDAVTHADASGRWVALRHTPRSQTNDDPPKVVAFDVASGKVLPLDVPRAHFVEPIGFAPSTMGGDR